MGRKRKNPWGSDEARDAHNARVDETLRRLRLLAEKAQAELDARKQAAEGR